MSILVMILIFLCIGVDNMVSSNMSAINITTDNRSTFSVKLGLFFTMFNALWYLIGFILSGLFFHHWTLRSQNWVAFAFILLLGIKLILESIEKSPSFNNLTATSTKQITKVAAEIGLNSLLVGFAAETMGRAFFPQIMILMVITFLMSILGFHLGKPDSRTVISKKIELVAGIILIFVALGLIVV